MANDLHFIKKQFRENILVKNSNSLIRENFRNHVRKTMGSIDLGSGERLDKIKESGYLSPLSQELSMVEESK